MQQKKLQQQFFLRTQERKVTKKRGNLDFFIHLVLHLLLSAPAGADSLILQLLLVLVNVSRSKAAGEFRLVAAGLSQQLLVVQSGSQRASHVSGGVFHVPSCSDGSVQRAVHGALPVGRQGAS